MKNENLPDEENPDFIFSGTSSKLLVMAINNEIDLLKLVKKQLVNRGLDKAGKWVGFVDAQKNEF